MKKVFLLAISALALSASVSAQQKTTATKINVAAKQNMNVNKAVALASKDAKLPKRSAASGVFYSRPEGTLYRTFDKEGMGWSLSILATAPQNDNIYVNQCNNPASARWEINGNPYDGDENNNFRFGSLGTISPAIDGTIDHLYYVPTILTKTDSYTLGEANEDGIAIHCDELAGHQFFDNNTAGMYGFGAYDTGYLFGNGIINFSNEPDVDYYGYGFRESYPSPTYPLYVEDVYAMVYTSGGAPITGDAELYMTIYDKDGNEITALTAGANDISEELYHGNVQYTKTGEYGVYILTFSKKELDSFGNEVVVPFVLDDAFEVVVEGMNQEGIDCGFRGAEVVEEDDWTIEEGCKPLITDGEGVYSFQYSGVLSADIVFNSVYDYVEVPTVLYSGDDTYEDTNILVVSADGKTQKVESTGDEYVYVTNAFDWYTEDGDENYFFTELPDWIASYEVEDIVDADGERTGMAVIAFEIDALPAGVNGRTASLKLEGKGYTSENEIIIVQGEATAINNVSSTTNSSAVSYNAMGQKVAKNVKGLVINNGKKYMNK